MAGVRIRGAYIGVFALGLTAAACATGLRADPDAAAGDRDTLWPSIDSASDDDGGGDAGTGPDADVPEADAPVAPPDAAPVDGAVVDGAVVDGAVVDGAVPDAMPPDAAPPDAAMPDAAPPDAAPPDAAIPDAGCSDVVETLLVNGDFELGSSAGWNQSSSGGYNLIYADADLPIVPHAGAWAGWLGGYNSAVERIYQDVAVPADARSLRVRLYIWSETDDSATTAFDVAEVQLRTSGDVLTEVLASSDNTDPVGSWRYFDLTPAAVHAGETLRVAFAVTTDASLPTNFYVDTFAVEALVCR